MRKRLSSLKSRFLNGADTTFALYSVYIAFLYSSIFQLQSFLRFSPPAFVLSGLTFPTRRRFEGFEAGTAGFFHFLFWLPSPAVLHVCASPHAKRAGESAAQLFPRPVQKRRTFPLCSPGIPPPSVHFPVNKKRPCFPMRRTRKQGILTYFNQITLMQNSSHTFAQYPQRTHLLWSQTHLPSTMDSAP